MTRVCARAHYSFIFDSNVYAIVEIIMESIALLQLIDGQNNVHTMTGRTAILVVAVACPVRLSGRGERRPL